MLPVEEYLSQINQALSENPSLVLQAEPGAGKSTALPLHLIKAKYLAGKKIVMLEPRRVAARSIAHYLASQLGEAVGQTIGYQVRNDRKVSNQTKLEIVTEGILTRRLQADPELNDIALIIFDEFHERSLHADLSLMLALEIQQSLREDLKLLVMSATIDTKQIASYLCGAEIIECPGRTFAVSVAYTTTPKDRRDLPQSVTRALQQQLATTTSGDTLVFLPGQREIRQSIAEAEKTLAQYNCELLPLHGSLPLEQQEKALKASNKRRIIFSTNIAETSLTIEGVTCVIDSGLERVLVYDPTSDMTRLETAYISQASAEQRKGRAGRLQAGHCVRLWAEQKQSTLIEYQPEEVRSSDLTSLVLELIHWGNAEYQAINWLTPPPKAHFDSAKNTLQLLGLIDSNSRLTPLGNKANNFGVHPRLAALLLSAKSSTEQILACELVALLGERDIFQQKRYGVDIASRLLAIQEYKRNKNDALKRYPMRKGTVEQLLLSSRNFSNRLHRQLDKKMPRQEITLETIHNTLGLLLLKAYPDRLAKQRTKGSERYQLANGRGVFLFKDDALYNSEWLLVTDADGRKREGQIYTAASISQNLLTEKIEAYTTTEESYQYDQQKNKIIGRRVKRFLALELENQQIPDIPPDKFHNCLTSILRTQAFELLNWSKTCEDWLARATWLGEHLDEFPKLNKQVLLETLDDWLIPYLTNVKNIAGLKSIKVFDLLIGVLTWDQQQTLKQQAPTSYTTPSNKTVPITYDTQQGPTVSVVLQEMFGEIKSPTIGGGKVPLRFELLSPARRPIQTTSDLANFWRTSYFEVAKDMRGRYPKHRWPEEPLKEKPGRSIKRKT